MVIISFKLDHIEFPPPVEWPEIRFLSEFINDSVEAKTSIEVLRFVGPAAAFIIQWRLKGLTGGPGIFEGPSFEMTVKDSKTGDTYTIKGFCDMSDGSYIERSPVDVSCKIGRLDLLSDLDMKLSGVTLALLANLAAGQPGKISASDFTEVRYVVQQDFNFADFFSLLATAFMILKEIISLVKEIIKDLGVVIGMISGGVTSAGAIIYAALTIVLNIAYAIVLFKVLIDLLDDIMSYIYPLAKKIKGITLEKALIKIFEYAGYSFLSTFSLLPKIVYLPSKPQNADGFGSKLLTSGWGFNMGGTTGQPVRNKNLPSGQFAGALPNPKTPDFEGIPNAGDYGYRAIEMVDLCKQLCLGKLRVNNARTSTLNPNGTIELYPLKDPYWKTQSSFQCADVLDETKVFNTPELNSTVLISYTTDLSDPWTIEEQFGSNYQIDTTAKIKKESCNVSLKGYKETIFPVALGHRKGDLNKVEEAVAIVAGVLDDAIDFFNKTISSVTNTINSLGSGSSNTTQTIQPSTLQQRVYNRESYLKIWNKYYSVPKLVYATVVLPDGSRGIPADYKQFVSVRALWNSYLNYVSWVENNYGGQKLIFTDKKVPMTFKEWFTQARKNRFFKLADGTYAEFDTIKHLPDKDIALITGKQQQIITKNLQETKIEAA